MRAFPYNSIYPFGEGIERMMGIPTSTSSVDCRLLAYLRLIQLSSFLSLSLNRDPTAIYIISGFLCLHLQKCDLA
jgi:hypothetical protein